MFGPKAVVTHPGQIPMFNRSLSTIYWKITSGADGAQILSPSIRYNTIRNAAQGIVISDTASFDTLSATIENNVFSGISGFAINNETERSFAANDNYWGDDDATWDAGPQASDTNGGVTIDSFHNSNSLQLLTHVQPSIGHAGDTVVLHGANFTSAVEPEELPFVNFLPMIRR